MTNIHILRATSDLTYLQLETYRDIDRQIKALSKEKDAVGNELKAGYFLNHDDYIHEGRLIATYKPQVRISLDQKRLKEERPEIYEEYQTLSEHRVFLLK